MANEFDDDLFEPAKSEFPAKEDLLNRLVVIYPTGKTGKRPASSGGDPYPWYETMTVVLDDGPDGTAATELVGPAPQVLRGFQWSASGLVSRLMVKPSNAEKVGSLVGRINTMPNKIKGRTPPWSIAAPTEEEMALARQYADLCRSVRDEIKAMHQAAADENAFG